MCPDPRTPRATRGRPRQERRWRCEQAAQILPPRLQGLPLLRHHAERPRHMGAPAPSGRRRQPALGPRRLPWPNSDRTTQDRVAASTHSAIDARPDDARPRRHTRQLAAMPVPGGSGSVPVRTLGPRPGHGEPSRGGSALERRLAPAAVPGVPRSRLCARGLGYLGSPRVRVRPPDLGILWLCASLAAVF